MTPGSRVPVVPRAALLLSLAASLAATLTASAASFGVPPPLPIDPGGYFVLVASDAVDPARSAALGDVARFQTFYIEVATPGLTVAIYDPGLYDAALGAGQLDLNLDPAGATPASMRYSLFGQALSRIKKFCEEIDSESDGSTLCRNIEQDFVRERDHDFMLLVAVNSDVQVVGHLLAERVQNHGKLYIWVSQMEIDKDSGVSLWQEGEAFKWILSWQRELGAKGVRALTKDKTRMRWLRMLHGFKPALTVMRWEE